MKLDEKLTKNIRELVAVASKVVQLGVHERTGYPAPPGKTGRMLVPGEHFHELESCVNQFNAELLKQTLEDQGT